MAIYLVPGIQMVYRFPSPSIRSVHIFRWIRTFGHCLQSQALSNNCEVGTTPHFCHVFFHVFLSQDIFSMNCTIKTLKATWVQKCHSDPGRRHLFIRIFLFAGVCHCAYIACAGVPVLDHWLSSHDDCHWASLSPIHAQDEKLHPCCIFLIFGAFLDSSMKKKLCRKVRPLISISQDFFMNIRNSKIKIWLKISSFKEGPPQSEMKAKLFFVSVFRGSSHHRK